MGYYQSSAHWGSSGQRGYAGKARGNPISRYGAGSGNGTFTPKKPVRTFRDLEVYQKTLECSVLLVKDIRPALVKLKYDFLENMTNSSMSIPLYIGEAHSMRFASLSQGVQLLEKAMAGCNKMVIYLEQAKGLYGEKVNSELVEDIIGRYVEVRTKMFRLEKSWKKFSQENSNNEPRTYTPRL